MIRFTKSLFTALAVCAGLLLAVPAMADIETGKAAPDFTFTDINGTKHSIAGFKGKTVILEWTNEGCPFVQKFYTSGKMQALQKETVAEGAVWVTVNSSAEGQQAYLNTEDAKAYFTKAAFGSSAYVLDHDGAFGKLYGAKTTPHMFVIDAEGVVVYQGAIDSIKSADAADITKADNYVVAALEALRKGEKPQVGSAAPYGCAVKYAK